MKLLALLGYPRSNGHTADLAERFLAGAAEAGADIRRIALPAAGINPCRGCYTCWTKTPGECIQKDGMASLLQLLLDADLLMIASPVYAFSVSSYVKIFIERTLPLMKGGVETSRSGIERNRLRYPGRGPRRMAAILVGGLKSPEILQPAADTLRLWASSFDIVCSGFFCRSESYALRFPQSKPLRMKALQAALVRGGREFVRQDAIPDEVFRDVSFPLVADMPHFARYADIYWEHTMAHPETLDNSATDAANDVRILLYEMTRCIDPVATRTVRAVLQFDFPDRDWHFRISVDNGNAAIEETSSLKPDLRITCPSTLWAEVVQRKISGAKAMAHPGFRINGDRDLFRKLPRFFPPPND